MRKVRSRSRPAAPAVVVATVVAISVLLVGRTAAAPGDRTVANGHPASRVDRLGPFAEAKGVRSTLVTARRGSGDGVDIRAVLADPAIRRFIGPSDYAWDFNAPRGMPGFAPLPPAVRREPPRQLTADEAARSAVGPPASLSTSIRLN